MEHDHLFDRALDYLEEQYAIFYLSSSHVGYYECEIGVAITERALKNSLLTPYSTPGYSPIRYAVFECNRSRHPHDSAVWVSL